MSWPILACKYNPGATYHSGCMEDPDLHGRDNTLRVAYSSVKHLPFHWSTPPYPPDAAGLAIALFRNGGKTWTKSARNPILAGEPAGVKVTGFRDPYVTELPLIPYAEGKFYKRGPVLYGLVSGGI
ncbi:hypothetical protein QBC40DRAFT_294363 [Triangularia verruculosa]|uniref:Uncharacterized protein n=1 Tax=Triangularia verruculosa TaxID=2587418 RepID=A0AAN7AZJ9_9PEZI|nr:hypothetical protein QBC40DRAFT_294363 [Triangularia verruculosa]